MPLIYPTLDAAIAKAEGYGTMGAIPTLAYNPGDIVAGPWATAHGATGSVLAKGGQAIAVFPDEVTGYAAEDVLIAEKYAGGSIADLGRGWLGRDAPRSDVDSWIKNLGLGLPASTPVSQTAAPASASTGATPSSPSLYRRAMDAIEGKGEFSKYRANPLSDTLFGLSLGRIAAFALGLIVIAGALYLFKPVQNVVAAVARA